MEVSDYIEKLVHRDNRIIQRKNTGGISKMKYHEGNIVLLKNGKTVYIVSVDEDEQKYLVIDAETADSNAKTQYVNESNIQMLVT